MSKLTLSVDGRVISRAKRFAKKHGLSVSALVEGYLASLERPDLGPVDTPILRSVRGSLKRAHFDDYRKHLAAKYR